MSIDFNEILEKIYEVAEETMYEDEDDDEEEYAQDYIEVISSNLNTILFHNIFLDKIKGCGSYGCVFGTNRPNYVAKITNDDKELELAKVLISRPLPGFVSYQNIVDLSLPNDLEHDYPGFWILIREEVTPIEESTKGSKLNDQESLATIIESYEDALYLTPEEIALAFNDMEKHSTNLFYIASSLRKMYEWGYVLTDLYPRNAGYSSYDDRLLFFDAQISNKISNKDLKLYNAFKEKLSVW